MTMNGNKDPYFRWRLFIGIIGLFGMRFESHVSRYFQKMKKEKAGKAFSVSYPQLVMTAAAYFWASIRARMVSLLVPINRLPELIA